MSISLIVYDWWRHRNATAALQGMDDRALRDIGIAREEIHHAVRFGRGHGEAGDKPRSSFDAASGVGYTRATKQRATDVHQIPVA